MSKHILSNSLYHCVPDESVADKIINSEYIKASSRATSYSINKWFFLFAGAPDIYSYMKNLTNANTKLNPFLNPKMVVDAIKYMPEANDLINYKCRSLNDEVMMYKGNCILPHGKVVSEYEGIKKQIKQFLKLY